ncbi:MAG: hypothetical protein ACYDBB_16170 [Armatimonadota bacterium]
MARRTHPLSKGEKILLGSVIALVVLILSLSWWWSDINALPTLTIPPRVMPSPNAQTYFVHAGDLVVNEDAIGDAINSIGNPHRKPTPPAELDNLLRQNLPAIKELRKGFAYTYCEPKAYAVDEDVPYAIKYRSLARILALQVVVNTLQENWPAVTRYGLDGMEMGVMCPHGSPLMMDVIGMALEKIMRRKLWIITSRLPARDATAAAHRLESIIARRTTWKEILQEEKWTALTSLLEELRSPEWRPSLREMRNFNQPTFARGEYLRALTVRKRTIFYQYTMGIDALIRDADRPYAMRAPLPMQSISYGGLYIDMYERERLDVVTNETQDFLLLVTLALQAYRQEHNGYPVTLNELTPVYLKTIPNDPFAKHSSLKYKRTGATYLLYSIGPNARDDGGTPCKDGSILKGTKFAYDHMLKSSSRGDIVAGVNVD